MATNRLEASKSADDAAKPADKKDAASAPAKSGGGKTWMPLILNLLLMPALAYGLTVFLLIPKIQGGKAETGHEGAEAPGEHGNKTKHTAPLGGKVLVNVAGTAGTRYLVANITLVGKSPTLKELVEQNDPQLRDAASSILGIKTIGDLEKPGMRNIIRAELIAAFNDILGKETISDIYLTEFAIQ